MNTSKLASGIWAFMNSKIFLYLGIVIGVIFFMRSCQKNGELERQAIFDGQNLLALNDTITTVKTKNGELNSSITGHILTQKELRKTNIELFEDVKQQEGQVLTLSKAVIRLKQDKQTLQNALDEANTHIGDAEQINDSTYQLPWTLTYQYDSLNYDIFSGRTELFSNCNNVFHNNTWLESRETQINLTFGQVVEDDKLRVFVQSAYPGFTTESLQGVLIDPNDNPYIKSLIKPKRWFPGASVGVGTTIGFNPATGGIGMTIGPTFNLGIYSFKR